MNLLFRFLFSGLFSQHCAVFLCVHFTRVSIVLVAKSHLCRGVREVFVDLARDRGERNALFLVHAKSDEGVL